MKLTILGCAGSYPGPDSPASGYLLQIPHDGGELRIVMDLGNGALGALQRYVDPRHIDAILLSHMHPDHCMDMCGLFVASRYHPDGPYDRIPVWAPDGAGAYLAMAYGGVDGDRMDEQFDFHAWDPAGSVSLGPARISVARVVHPVPAFAIRVAAHGRSLVYTGDTGPTPVLGEFASGADVLLAEASFVERLDNPPDLHLTGAQAAQSANEAGVERLLLTHIPAWTDPAEVLADAHTVRDEGNEIVRAGNIYDI